MSNWSKLDQLLVRLTEGDVPGCGVVVMQNNQVVHEAYAGYADVERGIKVDENSIFRHASSTKLFTYVIGMMLYEEGRFRFTDPIGAYLPEWKKPVKVVYTGRGERKIVPAEREITIRDAFSMTCGLPYCMGPTVHDESNPTIAAMAKGVRAISENGRIPTLREEVRAASQAPLMFEPGSHWLYGFGSEIVGALVETITGKTVRRNMQERLIEPLGLQNTATLLGKEMMERLVTCYEITEDHREIPMPHEQEDILKPGSVPEGARANLNSNCRDFAVFLSMLANGGTYQGIRLLGRKSIDLMRTNQLGREALEDFRSSNGNDLAGYGYGLGVRTLMDKAPGGNNGSIGEFGWSGGYGTWALADPEEHLAIFYAQNTRGQHAEENHILVRQTVYGCLE